MNDRHRRVQRLKSEQRRSRNVKIRNMFASASINMRELTKKIEKFGEAIAKQMNKKK